MLITERGQLKGISNKAKLNEVKKEIEKVSSDLKQSTAKLVRQLHENPDVAGNDKMIEKHKLNLVALINSCCEEQLRELKFEKFEREIKDKLQDQQKYNELK